MEPSLPPAEKPAADLPLNGPVGSAASPPPAQSAIQDVTDSQGAIGANLDATIPAPVYRELTVADFHSPRPRKLVKPALLFLATCISTFWAGATHWEPYLYFSRPAAEAVLRHFWADGLQYMLAVIGILLTHEMGHFIQAVRYHVPASWPFFIPIPISTTGTMGAVISMEGSRANRKQLFDIGLSGPLAGLAVAIPVIWLGLRHAHPATPRDVPLADPLIFKLMAHYLRPDLAAGAVLSKNNPLLMAGWVGMLITGLNMLPISQLDGGHVIYGLFGRRAHWIARAFLIVAIAYIIVAEQYNWSVILVLVTLLGVDHPPTRDDRQELGPVRFAIGMASLSIPVLCFTPVIMI